MLRGGKTQDIHESLKIHVEAEETYWRNVPVIKKLSSRGLTF
jgi:hypothetical protein